MNKKKQLEADRPELWLTWVLGEEEA